MDFSAKTTLTRGLCFFWLNSETRKAISSLYWAHASSTVYIRFF